MKHIHPKLIQINMTPVRLLPTSINLLWNFLGIRWNLTHSIQLLHQWTTDALNNIAKCSSLQENLHFFSDIPIFKAKDPQSFDDWLQQIDRVASFMNRDPYKLTFAKSQRSLCRTISSYLPTLGWNKIKEWLCYNFGSVNTKQHAASLLTETLQE